MISFLEQLEEEEFRLMQNKLISSFCFPRFIYIFKHQRLIQDDGVTVNTPTFLVHIGSY